MFNLGFSELVLIGIIALIFIGPKQLPELARTVGRLLNELKRSTREFTSSFSEINKDVKESISVKKEDLFIGSTDVTHSSQQKVDHMPDPDSLQESEKKGEDT